MSAALSTLRILDRSDHEIDRPTNVFVGGGDESVDELVAGVERGIYVSAFNYCRILDPKTMVVTGLTRNGTFLIENGRITAAVSNM